MNHGQELRTKLLDIQEEIRENGKPVQVDGRWTAELINYSYQFNYDERIDLNSIKEEMIDYYKLNKIDYSELEELEEAEYDLIRDTLLRKANSYTIDDIHSRRILWTDDCCISFIQYLIRDGKINCYVHFRSSDAVNKLFSDLYLIHDITSRLQDKFCLYNTTIYVTASSIHEIVI